MKHERLCGVLAALAIMLGGVADAYAYEGTFSSYLRNVVSYFTSRTWKDLNRTTNATAISFSGCHIQTGNREDFFSTGVTLKQSRGILPAKNMGTRSYPCARRTGNNGRARSWGRQAAGTYYFEIAWTPGGDSMSVNKVNVTW